MSEVGDRRSDSSRLQFVNHQSQISNPSLRRRFCRRDPQPAEQADDIEQLRHVERLLEDHRRLQVEVVRLELVRRDHDDGELLPAAAEPPQPFAAIHFRHLQVEDDEEDVGVVLDERDGLLAAGIEARTTGERWITT